MVGAWAASLVVLADRANSKLRLSFNCGSRAVAAADPKPRAGADIKDQRALKSRLDNSPDHRRVPRHQHHAAIACAASLPNYLAVSMQAF